MKKLIALFFLLAASVYASRQFTETSGQFMARTTAPVSTYPCTISAWYKPTNVTSNHVIVYIGSTTDARRFMIYKMSNAGGNVARASSVPDGGGAGSDAIGSTAMTDTTRWYHVVGVWASSTSRKIYVDGVLEATDTTSIATTSLNRAAIGARGNPAPTYGLFANAKIAEIGIWSVALTDSDVLQLAKGANPQWVQRTSLVSYVPLWTGLSPDADLVSGTFGLTNSPAQLTDHPPVFQ